MTDHRGWGLLGVVLPLFPRQAEPGGLSRYFYILGAWVRRLRFLVGCLVGLFVAVLSETGPLPGLQPCAALDSWQGLNPNRALLRLA